MPTASEYRAKAVELYAQAQAEPNSLFRGELENLALAYRGLAELADRNAGLCTRLRRQPSRSCSL